MMSKLNIAARRKARRLALQALYQWVLSGADPKTIELQFQKYQNTTGSDIKYFQELLYQIPTHVCEIDERFIPYLDRDITALNPIELITIRMAVYELSKRLDIPYKVVINEALELNKAFGSTDGYKYVNGILDKVAHVIRANEITP